MNQNNIERWFEIVQKLNEPLQEWTALTVTTFQKNFQSLLNTPTKEGLFIVKNPEDFFKKPEDFFVKLAIENGRTTLDYMQKSFDIMEKAFLISLKETKQTEDRATRK